MTRSVWLSLSLALCVCAPLASSSLVEAQTSDDQQAHAHFQVAASYYEQANYEAALREFLEAYRLSQRSQLFYNLSLCYQQLGDLDNAISYLERYLAEVADIENRASLETRLANLRERAAAAHAHDSAPVPVPTTEPAPDLAPDTATPQTPPPPPPSSGGSVNVGAIAAFSVAGVALILGATFTGLAAGEDSRIAGLPCAASSSCLDSDVSSLRTYALVADIMWGLSLAGAAAGLVLVIVNPGGGSSDQARLRVSPSLAGLVLDGSF